MDMWRVVLLFPFSLIYGIFVWLRNRLYDTGFIGTAEFDLPVIAVGNLQAGGTGKTPLVEYLVQLLKPHLKIAVLSRGYRRTSSGFVLANSGHTAADIGDEPAFLYRKHPDIAVAVGESREVAIPLLLSARPDTRLVLLDDAYQHRSVRPSVNILLTPFEKPFWKDHLLPAGMLREPVSEKKRADIIIMTKCPEKLTEDQEKSVIQQLSPGPEQQVFFSTIRYADPYPMQEGMAIQPISKTDTILLFAGIAYPEPLIDYIKGIASEVYWLPFDDHFPYAPKDIWQLKSELDAIKADHKRIITTEKDAARLLLLHKDIKAAGLPIEILPMTIVMTGSNAKAFDELIFSYLRFYWS